MTDSIQVQEQLIQDLGARVREVDAAISGKNQLVKEIELSLLEQQQKHSATLEEKERLNSIWQDVNRQQEQAIADLAAARQQEQAALESVDAQRQQMEQNCIARQEAMESRLCLAREKYEASLINSNTLSSAIEDALRKYTQQQKALADAIARYDKNKQSMQESFAAASDELSAELLKHSSRLATLINDRDSAQHSADLAQRQLDESMLAQEVAEQEISELELELEKLKKQRQQAAEENQTKSSVARAAASSAEENFSRAIADKKEQREKALSLARLAERAAQDAQVTMNRQLSLLKKLYQEADARTSAFSDKMSAVLKKVADKRNSASDLLNQLNELEKQLKEAEKTELQSSSRLTALRSEVQELNNVAAVAADLAKDATNSRASSVGDISPIMIEMEEALTASAKEAALEAEKRRHDLRRAEYENRVATNNALRKKHEIEVIRKRYELARRECAAAEQELCSYSDLIEERASVNIAADPQIIEARASYEQARQQAMEQKQAADIAGNNLRQLKAEIEKMERNFLDSMRQSKLAIHKREQEALAEEEDFQIQINTAEAQLRVSREKRERLLAILREREQQHSDSQLVLEEKIAILQKTEADLQTLKNRVDADIETMRQRMGEKLALEQEGLRGVRQQANSSSEDYTALLLDAIKTARVTIVDKKALQAIVEEQYALREQIKLYQLNAEKEYQRQLEQAQLLCKEQQEKINQLTEKTIAVRQEITDTEAQAADILRVADEIREQIAGVHTELEACREQRQQLMEEKNTAEAELLRLQEEAARQAAEAAAEAERQRLAEEEAARAAAEEERRLAEEAAEAARIAAEAEEARQAALREQEAREAEKQAIRLAVGDTLSREENLLLIDSGQMQDRLSRMQEMIREELSQEDYSYVPEAELELSRKEAAAAEERCLASAQLYDSAKLTATHLRQQQEQVQATLQALQQQLEEKRSVLATARAEQDSLHWIGSELERTREKVDPQGASAHFNAMYDTWKDSFAGASQQVEAYTDEITTLNNAVCAAQQELADLTAACAEARELLYEVACVWIYDENQNYRAQFRQQGITQSLNQRQLAAADSNHGKKKNK